MNNYDPKLYNFANLSDEDRLELSTLICHLVQIIELMENNKICDEFSAQEPFIKEIRKLIINEMIIDARYYIIQKLVELISNYGEDEKYRIHLRNTKNYFFGAKISDSLKNNEFYRLLSGQI